MEWESDSPFRSRTYHRRCSGWDLEFRDCGAIPGWGLLLTAERQMEGMWGRRLWWEKPVEESGQPWKQGDSAESRVGGGAITTASPAICHCSLQHYLQQLEHGSNLLPFNKWMGKEVVVHIHSGILLNHKKECIWVSSNEVDEPRTYHTEWSESEREW